MFRRLYGHASIEPVDDVSAGNYGTWTLTYTVGLTEINKGGCIRVTTDSDTDWGRPQFDKPNQAEYMRVYTNGKANLATVFDGLKSLFIRIYQGSLREGDKIFIIYGDRSSGSPGSRAQTFLEQPRYFQVSLDPYGAGEYIDLLNPPYLNIIGDSPERLVVIAPSIVRVDEKFRVVVKAEDKWGNPSYGYKGKITLSCTDPKASLPSEYTFEESDRGVHSFLDAVLPNEGLNEIVVEDSENCMVARSNPILSRKDIGCRRLYWGDLHGQVDLAVKANDYFRYARDVSAIDFAGFQRNDFNITDEDWKVQQKAEKLYNDPDKFITLPGYEWSAVKSKGGHRNVYFHLDDQPIRRSSHRNIEDRSDVDTDLHTVTELHEAFRDRDVILIPHVGGGKANLSFHDPKLEPVIEVSSSHGTFEWFLEEALERGYKVGFIAGSDDYMGRPGGSYPGFNDRRYAKGGLAGVFARRLTRDALWEALKRRRCYGTTGARIVLLFEADGHFMGEEYTTNRPPKLSVFVAGTSPIEKVEVMRGLDIAYSHPISSKSSPDKVRILWEGSSMNESYSGVVWDGKIELEGGKLNSVKKIRFDSPRSKIFKVSDKGLRWHSITCGYSGGLILGLDAARNTKLKTAVKCKLITGPRFSEVLRMSLATAEQIEISFRFSDLKEGPITVDVGTLGRKIIFSRAPSEDEVRNLSFEFVDRNVRSGLNAYHIRVTQTDMEKAWSSPIFVNFQSIDRKED